MARPKKFVEDMLARFVAGTFARMDAVRGDADRADLVREAVEAELRRRERLSAKSSNKSADPAASSES
jgi:hypothetical protein